MSRSILLAPALVGAFLLARASTPGADEAADPVAVVAHVDVMPNFTAQGRDLLRRFAQESRKDPGVVRFEVLEELGRPNHSTIVATWRTRKAFDDHLALEHTRRSREQLQPMLGSPFDERIHRIMP